MPATDTYWYNLKKMHVAFAVSAIGLLVVTLGMMWKDHDDEWREYQQVFDEIEETRLTEQIQAEQTESYEQKVARLTDELNEARAAYESNKQTNDEEIAQLELQVNLASRAVRNQRAERDKARADYDLAVRDNLTEEAARLKEIFDEEQQQVDELELDLQQKQSLLDAEKQEQKNELQQVEVLTAELKQAQADVDRMKATREKIHPEGWFASTKRQVMQWPVIDGFNSPRQVDQIWLPDLKITLGMAETARFDRCQTCHQGIGRVEAGNVPTFPHGQPEGQSVKSWVAENQYPHPYSTHPNPDLYLTSGSPHPIQNFGCTICHDGQGSGTSFQNASHTPNNPHVDHNWSDKYHYHYNHFWEYPMLPERFEESSCLRCHHSVVELESSPKFGNSAPKLLEGFHTIEQFGCFGCHEIHGEDAGNSIGPDLRLEPNYFAVAQQIAAAAKRQLPAEKPSTEKVPAANGQSPNNGAAAAHRLTQILQLANQVADDPEDTPAARKTLQQLMLADIGLENPLFPTRIQNLAEELRDADNPGLYRKVGPALRYVDSKTTPEWIAYWTEEPKRFRPDTRMPQFFHLSNQRDEVAEEFQPVQLAAISHYLIEKSQPLDLLSPPNDYQPNAERGKDLFSKRGCLACHTHQDFPEITPEITKGFGPNLNKIAEKLKPGRAGFDWVYTWIRDPQRYHKRSRMPNLFLEAYTLEGQTELIDPAADIAAYLLKGQQAPVVKYPPIDVEADDLNHLVAESLGESLTKQQVDELFKTRKYPIPADQIKGDEIEMVFAGEGKPNDDQWQAMKMSYLGRRTIAQYGCYGCHDVPGFEAAKPIGTALQDWGRKDTSRLAFEHISEYLHHHGEPDGSSTAEAVENAMKRANADEFASEEVKQDALSTAFYYDSLLHHGRPGFLWQKLREPRSYDYKKIETKSYGERLLMPKFPFNNDQIEAVATFVLGLTAAPPAGRYLYQPQGATKARYEGEALLTKYNCASCHLLELPEVSYSIERSEEDQPSTYADAVGMTREQVIEWFAENRQQLLSETPPEYPSGIQLLDELFQAFEVGVNVPELARLASVTPAAGNRALPAREAQMLDQKFKANLGEWFDNHPEVLLVDRLQPDELPVGVRKLLRLKPPQSGEADQKTADGDAVIRFHGLLSGPPDLESPPEEQFQSYKLWETLDVGGRLYLPNKNMVFATPQLVNVTPGRGGPFAAWLADRLWKERRSNPQDIAARDKALQSSPPPLTMEGLKVQTPWLYQFLKNPERIRYETVLRMPRFNMSDGEARTLANYFAAVDDAEFPYQQIPQREEAYLSRMNALYQNQFEAESEDHERYLSRAWHMLGKNALCITCHSVAGAEFKAPDPTQVTHGPDLDTRIPSRLRPDWLEVWLYKPQWMVPYTGMVAPHTKPQVGYFDQNKDLQTTGLRDALINYNTLIQSEGKIEPPPPEAAAAAAAGTK